MQRIDSLVPKTLSGLGLAKKYRSQCVVLYWKSIVGPEVAEHAWPLRVMRGVLQVVVANSVWMNHLFLLKTEIIGKINTYMGETVVSDIRFRAGVKHREAEEEGCEEQMPLPLRLKTVTLTKDEVLTARNLVTSVTDSKLRRTLLNLLYKHAAYQRLKQQEGWQPCQQCGTLISPDAQRCVACQAEEHSRITADIIACLLQAPWQKYAECCQSVPCALTDYIQARQSLMSRLAEKVRLGQADSMEQTILAMLATGLSPQELTDKMIEQQLAKFGRKKDVSAPRSGQSNSPS